MRLFVSMISSSLATLALILGSAPALALSCTDFSGIYRSAEGGSPFQVTQEGCASVTVRNSFPPMVFITDGIRRKEASSGVDSPVRWERYRTNKWTSDGLAISYVYEYVYLDNPTQNLTTRNEIRLSPWGDLLVYYRPGTPHSALTFYRKHEELTARASLPY